MDNNFADLKLEEIDKREIKLPESKIRRGGKNPSGLPPLKHSNFYYCFNTGLHYASYQDKEGIKRKIRDTLNELSKKIDEEFLIIQGSQQGLNTFKLPIEDKRETLKLRINGSPKIKIQFEVGKQSGLLIVHYVFGCSKRGLDTQIDNRVVKEFFDTKIGFATTMKSVLYRDAKCDIEVYSQKAGCV